MNQIEALKELLGKVEAEDVDWLWSDNLHFALEIIFPELMTYDLSSMGKNAYSLIYGTYQGSLDAAKALHEAALEDRWVVKLHLKPSGPSAFMYGDFGTVRIYSATSARAWLAAIIKAYIIELESK